MDRLSRAIAAFDAYNAQDPNKQLVDGVPVGKELLYAQRMTATLNSFIPHADEYIQLAVRGQHIGRWEVPRSTFPEGRKGYLQWRSTLQQRHAQTAEQLLHRCGYEQDVIDKVKFMIQKKELHSHHPDTQLLEDVVCLVFIRYYLGEFASRHTDEKVTDILRKTWQKMSPAARAAAGEVPVSSHLQTLIARAKSS